MMDLVFKILFIQLVIVGCGFSKEYCPKLCICDVFDGFKRADCSDQNLISPYTNIAKTVQILNLSGNDITVIDEQCLVDLQELINLSFARNSIHTIELFAFNSLNKLSYLDLSDNRLEEIDNRILENNNMLTFLDLSKNKFMMVADKPLVMSLSLQYLSLRNSHLSHIYDSLFRELPALVDLDVSNNLLVTVLNTAVEPLKKLQFVNMEYNRFSCDLELERTLQLLKDKKVHVKIDKCVKNSKKPMFEKMIMHLDLTTEAPREDIDIDMVWGEMNDSSDEIETDDVKSITFRGYYDKLALQRISDGDHDCEVEEDQHGNSLCECQKHFLALYDDYEVGIEYQKLQLEQRIAIIFYVAFFIGIMAGCVIFYGLYLIKKKCENANMKQVERQLQRNRLAQTRPAVLSPGHCQSPMPTVRNRTAAQPRQPVEQRTPIPAPRNPSNSGRFQTIQQNEERRQSELISREQQGRSRNLIQIPERVRYEYSPTAQLIQNLFKRRAPKLQSRDTQNEQLADPETQPLTSVVASSSRSTDFQQDDGFYSEISLPTAPNNNEDDDSSQYLSIDDLSLNLDFRTGSITPPPPYGSVFDEK